MAADPTLVQGAGMAVKRHRGVVFAKGLQALQESISEGMVEGVKYFREQKKNFNDKIQAAINYGEGLTTDQYSMYLDKYEEMANQYAFAGPKKRALMMQEVNRDITSLGKASDIKVEAKNNTKGGKWDDEFEASELGQDVAGVVDGSNAVITNEAGESGYMLYDNDLKNELIKTYENLKNTNTDAMNETELANHNKLLKEAELKLEDPLNFKKFHTLDEVDSIIKDNVHDNVFADTLLKEANEQFEASKGLPYNTNQTYNLLNGSNKVYAWMQNANRNSMLNHALGPDVSFREGLTQAIQTMTYTEAGIMVDHDSDSSTPPINIEDAFGKEAKGIAHDVDGDGDVDEEDIKLIRADAAVIVDELIKADNAALWGRGGYVNTFFNNFLKQNFERGKGERADMTSAQRGEELLLSMSDEEFRQTQVKNVNEDDIEDWADSDNNPKNSSDNQGNVDISADATRYKTLTLEDVNNYSLKERWDLYTIILQNPNIPITEKQAFMKDHGLKTVAEHRGKDMFARKKKVKYAWRGLGEITYQEWADEQTAIANLADK